MFSYKSFNYNVYIWKYQLCKRQIIIFLKESPYFSNWSYQLYYVFQRSPCVGFPLPFWVEHIKLNVYYCNKALSYTKNESYLKTKDKMINNTSNDRSAWISRQVCFNCISTCFHKLGIENSNMCCVYPSLMQRSWIPACIWWSTPRIAKHNSQ